MSFPNRARRLKSVLCLDDFETAGRRVLPRPIFEYVAGAAETNISFRRNRSAFDDYSFIPRTLIDVSKRSQAVELFGRQWSVPFGIAPMGICALSAYRGDVVLATAAQELNMPMIMSGSSLIRMEEVAAVAPGCWFQAYLPGDFKQMVELVARVRATGFPTLVLTADTPLAANRENNIRAGFSTPLRPTPRLAWEGITHPDWLFATFLKTMLKHGMPHFENNYPTRGAPIMSRNVLRDFSDRSHFNWDYFAEIRRMWPGSLVLKGVLSKDDALIAKQRGVDGIIVSNHGGRQLDGAVAPLRVLPEIVDAVGDLPVMLDSGIRRGSDALKAMALGARMVFLGRSFNFAAAVAGAAGVAHAHQILSTEISRNMGLLGVTALDQLRRAHLRAERD